MAKQMDRKSSAVRDARAATGGARRERGAVEEELLGPIDARPGPARRLSVSASAALVDSVLAKVFADA